MTLRERNLVLKQLKQLHTYTRNDQFLAHAAKAKADCLAEVDRAIEIMKRQPLSSPGLPVSAGGDPEEPRYCVECGEPALENHLTCGEKACNDSFWRRKGAVLK